MDLIIRAGASGRLPSYGELPSVDDKKTAHSCMSGFAISPVRQNF